MNELLASLGIALASSLGLNDQDWKLQLKQDVLVHQEKSQLIRFQRKDERNNHLYGEHLSLVLDSKNQLKGFVRLEEKQNNLPLVSKEEAKEISDQFLQQVAPDLLESRKILWIEPHDEKIIVNRDGQVQEKILTGMKVKSQNTKTGLYFWTIVNADKQVYIFERDIQWITFPGRRGTEKWLHDAWLEQQWQGNMPNGLKPAPSL